MGRKSPALADAADAPASAAPDPRPAGRRKVDRRKAPETKTRILDAAETLFAQRGFHGVSLRDITQMAGVQLALSHYHFGSKEDLFRAVVDRRAVENVRGLRDALDRAIASGNGGPPRLEALIRAFIEPVLRRLVHGGAGWKNYVQLLARVANQSQEEAFQAPVNDHYDNVVRDFVAQIRLALPRQDAVDMHWGFYFLQATITHMLLETGVADRQSNGLCHSRDIEDVIDRMTRFFAAGLRHMGVPEGSV